MPNFDLRGIRVAKYANNSGTITYSSHCAAGDAMSANVELRFAEGRLYAESKLAEFIKLATGGSISLAVKYIPSDAQVLMYGATAVTGNSTPTGLKYTAKDNANYVGCVFYAPDKIDGETKYTCVFLPKVLFGPPSMAFATKGENITFNTPTTTGEFLADDSDSQLLIETATAATEDAAKTWCKGKLGET